MSRRETIGILVAIATTIYGCISVYGTLRGAELGVDTSVAIVLMWGIGCFTVVKDLVGGT